MNPPPIKMAPPFVCTRSGMMDLGGCPAPDGSIDILVGEFRAAKVFYSSGHTDNRAVRTLANDIARLIRGDFDRMAEQLVELRGLCRNVRSVLALNSDYQALIAQIDIALQDIGLDPAPIPHDANAPDGEAMGDAAKAEVDRGDVERTHAQTVETIAHEVFTSMLTCSYLLSARTEYTDYLYDAFLIAEAFIERIGEMNVDLAPRAERILLALCGRDDLWHGEWSPRYFAEAAFDAAQAFSDYGQRRRVGSD